MAPLMAQNELIDFQNDKTEKWDTVSISNRARQIRCFALERWNCRKPGQKSSEIAKNIPLGIAFEAAMEEGL